MGHRALPPNYFLVAVANRQNLDLCIKYALAGFPNSGAGVWTFCEISEGDFISFLYGARVFNLYEVVRKEAIREFENLPPWPPLRFRESGRIYHFPFRLHLALQRELSESLVRPEFAYIAENLLLRAGYRKTHFQADQTTLQNVSQMGRRSENYVPLRLDLPDHSTFTPLFTQDQSQVRPPFVNRLSEVMLQSAIRHRLRCSDDLGHVLARVGLDAAQRDRFEVLGEKALPQGHVDILIKDRVPIASARKVVIEVKLSGATLKDVHQLRDYVEELGSECLGGILIARSFSRQTCKYMLSLGLHPAEFDLGWSGAGTMTFEELVNALSIRFL